MTNLWMYDQKVILDTDRILQAIPGKEGEKFTISMNIDGAYKLRYAGPMAQALWDYLASRAFVQGAY